jgi:hypothetical protein
MVDEMDDRVGRAYSGMPDRMYLIDRKGRIAYKGGRGPFGFKPGELEQALVMLLVDQTPSPPQTTERRSMLTNDEAWKRLPGAPEKVQSLPAWARILAGPLPTTTARMLELDALHRSGNRLEPRLRGLVRWAAADANLCDYAKAVAAADLRRAGVGGIEKARREVSRRASSGQASRSGERDFCTRKTRLISSWFLKTSPGGDLVAPSLVQAR